MRDRIWAELYCSDELRKAAKFLISHNNLHEDLLSDALITVFEKRKDFIELHQNGRLKGYVFRTMYSMVKTRTPRENSQAWAKLDKWAQRYGLAEYNTDHDRTTIADEPGEVIDVLKSEVDYSTQLFGSASELSIKLMRKIEEYDSLKESRPDLWEAAQYTKLYYHFGSYQEVADQTGAKRENVWKYVQVFKKSLEEKRMKIAVVTREKEPQNGMELYRLFYPYFNGIHTTHKEQFEVQHISYQFLANQPQGALDSDVYVFSRLQHPELADKVLSEGKKFVLDIDDYWNVHAQHPLRNTENNKKYVSTITGLIPKAHLVTTTSDLLSERIHEELGVKSVVIKNTIPTSVVQFTGSKYPSSLVRFGWIGGTHHAPDIELMRDGLKRFHSDHSISGKYQICLGGYNVTDSDYKHHEDVLSSGYYCVRTDSDYKEYLSLNTPALDHIGYNKPYRRMWSKHVHVYGEMYREIDVALIPLLGGNLFNSCKSELKLIEAGMTGTAAIVSDVKPYAPHLVHEKNCLKISPQRQEWWSQMRRMIVDEELRKDVAANLSKYVRKNFNHEKETNKLAAALKKLG